MNEFVKNNIVEVDLDNPSWLMTRAERCALIGLISQLRPKSTLEIGYRFGGCTEFLAKYSGNVTTVDLDAFVMGANDRWSNTVGVQMDSKDFLKGANANKWHYDFAVIDGDHSRAGAAADLKLALPICGIIILHDTMNPECRQGYLDALAGFKGYFNLDFVLNSGIWGGLGIVVTNGAGT